MKNRIRPLCETPKSGIFCGHDKYLSLQEHTISTEMFPVMEYDSYFIYIKEGHGTFIINGEEFLVHPGCIAWIQASQVLTICPDFGEELTLWVCPYDYPLLSYYSFSNLTPSRETEIVSNIPIIAPDGPELEQISLLFSRFRELARKKTHGSAIIRSSYLRKIELLYNRIAQSMKSKYKFNSLPLSRKASLYIAMHSTSNITIEDVVNAIAPSSSESALNHALLIATGMNFSQYLNRLRISHAMSYFLYDGLSYDYISSISGFNMEITFFRRFKAMTGMTPQTYFHHITNNGKHGCVYRGTIMNETLVSAISYLYENMTDPIDAETITRELYTSENILRVQFKSHLNSSYKQVLSQFRVRYAEALLTTTNLPTVDIAIESGFGSDRTMVRIFCNINGISPGEFRKQRCPKHTKPFV